MKTRTTSTILSINAEAFMMTKPIKVMKVFKVIKVMRMITVLWVLNVMRVIKVTSITRMMIKSLESDQVYDDGQIRGQYLESKKP